jgi:hypothetical protein
MPYRDVVSGSIGGQEYAEQKDGPTLVWALIAVSLMVWLGVVIIGFAARGLSWVAILGLVMFVATSVFGACRIDATGPRPPG